MHWANASALHLLCCVLQDAVQQPLTNVVNTLEQKRVQQHNQKARLDSMTTMVIHNKTHAQERKECHTCGRRLAEGREMEDFFSRQVSRALHVPWSSRSRPLGQFTTNTKCQHVQSVGVGPPQEVSNWGQRVSA